MTRRKLFLTIVIFLFSFLTLITTTFAWFSLAQSVYIDSLSMSVVTDEYLYLSLDGINYSQTITKEMLNQVIKREISLKDVTTLDGETFYSSSSHDTTPIANIDYLSFTLWAKTNNTYVNSLFLADNVSNYYDYDTAEIKRIDGTYAYSKGQTYKTPVTFQYDKETIREANTISKYYASDALRIGINELNCDNENLLEKDTRTNLSSFIYDISENEERGFGKLYGAYDFNLKLNSFHSGLPPSEPNMNIYKLSTYGLLPYETNEAASKCATFQEGMEDGKSVFYAKIQVNIWLEGWDADCFNAILSDNILMQLKFRSAKLLTN